jgi:photosystem II stability/assembly factor-like uncharacterized protein
MPAVRVSRTTAVLVLGVCGAALVSSFAGASGAATRPLAAAAAPPKTVTAVSLAGRQGTLAPGSKARPARIFSNRVFTDAKHGFALGSPQDADYALATADGGKTWKTDSPALHLHALSAPFAVLNIGAANRKTVFAWGGGQVIDATSDGGKTWYQALWEGQPLAVAPNVEGGLLAVIGSFSGKAKWIYSSTDGGRSWDLEGTVH